MKKACARQSQGRRSIPHLVFQLMYILKEELNYLDDDFASSHSVHITTRDVKP
jgi:hypothetical protein